ncbi:MAG TPA: FAD-binding protein, partial [Myxococcota bacterium]|nr:FAD-binding protein [Myxococcota bacterium]
MLQAIRQRLLCSTAASPATTPSQVIGPVPQRGAASPRDSFGPIFGGRLDRTIEGRRAAAQDFGHGIDRLPFAVLVPKDAHDIRRAVILAAAHHFPIAVRGQGHSAYGQTQAANGIVIDTKNMQSLRWAGPECIDAGPGANWLDVAKFALARGLTPPVMPDTSICLTVGGTLSVGGWGETTHRFGGQVDHVVELEVVTGTGARVVCSRERHRQLFEAMLAGMGQCGIIVRARLAMVKAPATATQQVVQCKDAADFVATMRARAGEPDNAIVGTLTRTPSGFVPSVTTNRFDVERPAEPTRPFWDYVDRNTKGFLDSVKSGDIHRPHPYISFFIPERVAVGMVERLLREPELTFGADRVVAFPYVRESFHAPMFALPNAESGFHVRVYKKPVLGDVAGQKRMLATNDVFMKDILAAGGTVYLPHAPIPTSEQLEQHYGPERLAAFRA